MKYRSLIISDTHDIRTAVMLLTIITLKIRGGVGAVIVASPRDLYILNGQEGVLRCQNRTTSPYTYVSNARWFLQYANGSNISFDTSDSVYVYKHTVTFFMMSRENEGKYFCCTASLTCSNIAYARISVPPSIVADKSYYTAIIGSQIALKCNITDQGIPPAEFRWRIDGREIIDDNVTVFTSQSAITIIISNMTTSDAGTYICEAANEQSYRNDRIELRIEPHYDENLTTTGNNTAENKTLLLKLLAINIQVSCQVFKQSLQTILQHLIWENYGYTVMVMAKQIECRTTEGKGIYDVVISGFLTNDSLQPFIADLNNTEQGIDLVIGKLKLCYKSCLEPSPTSSDSDSSSEDANVIDNINIWMIAFIILLIFLLPVLVIFCFVIFYKSYFWTSNKTAEYQINQQTTIAGPTLNADDTTTNDTREASTISDSIPPDPQYSTLQFKYNNQCNSTHYSKLSTSHSGSKNGYLHLQHHNLPQKKNTSPSLEVNTMHVNNDLGTKDNSTVTVTSNPDGGRIQAILPANVDNNYNVIPSPTYKSYVDVIY